MGDPLALAVLAVLFALPLVTLVWQPTWLKPAWLQWLEANYGPGLEKMFKKARQMGPSQWEAQVKTQAGLEQWANEVARKNKWKRINQQEPVWK